MSHPEDMLEVERLCAIENDNMMHAWAAYRLARLSGVSIPEWVLRYFDEAGRNLLALSAEIAKYGNGKGVGPKIAKSIGLASDGAGSPLTKYHADWMVFGLNVRARMLEGDKEDIAVETVARDAGVSMSTVRRSFKTYDRLFPGQALFPDEALTKKS